MTRASVLDEIIAFKRQEVADRRTRLNVVKLRRRAAVAQPPRGFRAALAGRIATGEPAIIAEVKKASPSAGVIRPDFDPEWIAERYVCGGATAISVLTDERYFQGHDRYLEQVHASAALPVLRKDFLIDPYQLVEARALGADAVLLIVAALDDATLVELAREASGLGMDVLVEVHDATELQRALAAGARLIGVNSRDLHSFRTDLAVAERLAAEVPADALLVAESGIHGPADLARLRAAGIGAFLVGESLMRAADPAAALADLLA